MTKIVQFEVHEVEDIRSLFSEVIQNVLNSNNSILTQSREPPIFRKELLTQKDAAEYLGISVQTLISWRHRGLIRGHTKSRLVYFFLDEIHQAIKEGNVKPKNKKVA